MKTLPAAVAGALAAALVALTACGNPVAGTPAPQPGPPPPSVVAPDPAADQQAVEAVFRDYYEALLARDFATACEFNAPETTQQLLANLQSRGITADTCEEALTAVYAIPGAAETVDGIVQGAQVQGVVVTGDTASITWSAEVNGARNTVTSQLRRVDGQWRLVDTGA
ncbi:hypothetical protein [Pseudonocardia kunmingensis]|uniref:Mce-associated membrane protein n=1 Tax=Pseudonocardia kunmingensis TaxID=630975 RepID=A0A543D3G9_9PSEU|nr:hypothetical protein [Pseudonocardia kunmingensis]TQM03886.1 hypothetical protein FB558_6911 [Pseudonocardia kunmingensis]